VLGGCALAILIGVFTKSWMSGRGGLGGVGPLGVEVCFGTCRSVGWEGAPGDVQLIAYLALAGGIAAAGASAWMAFLVFSNAPNKFPAFKLINGAFGIGVFATTFFAVRLLIESSQLSLSWSPIFAIGGVVTGGIFVRKLRPYWPGQGTTPWPAVVKPAGQFGGQFGASPPGVGYPPSGPPMGGAPMGSPMGPPPSGPPMGGAPMGPPMGPPPSGPPMGGAPMGSPMGGAPMGPPPSGPPAGAAPIGPPLMSAAPPQPFGPPSWQPPPGGAPQSPSGAPPAQPPFGAPSVQPSFGAPSSQPASGAPSSQPPFGMPMNAPPVAAPAPASQNKATILGAPAPQLAAILKQQAAASASPQASPQAAGAPQFCGRCGKPMTFVAQYQRWFCQQCQQYA